MDLGEKFLHYYENEWKDDEFYNTADFIKIFGTNRHLARHYLMMLVNKGHLFRIKYGEKVWYGKAMHIEHFKRFEIIGVKLK